MVVSQLSYEESRKKRLEDNKKRMEELNLNKLSQDLRPTPSPMKRVKPKVPRQPLDLSAVRRSSRFADQPARSYKEEPIEPLGRRSSSRSYDCRSSLGNKRNPTPEEMQYAFDKANELQSGLGSEFPSFVKQMLYSHVGRGFWLGLPVHFCKTHLPEHDEVVTLVDEDGNETNTKFLAKKTGLSAGWGGFAIDHGLVEGDALVYQLIKPTTFKVYIIRVHQVGEREDNDDEGDHANEEAANQDDVKEKEDDEANHANEEGPASVKKVDNSSSRRTRASKKK